MKLLKQQIDPAQKAAIRQRLQRLRRPAWLGSVRRTEPLSDDWGLDRGTPVDRAFITGFLKRHQADIHGDVLEIQNRGYTDRFGSRLTRSDVLDVDASNRRATVIADLANAAPIESNQYDCFILTQTLQFIFEPRAAIATAHRILRPGGVMLMSVPCVSRIDMALEQVDYWRFTPASVRELVCVMFPETHVDISVYGNVLTAVAFLLGMASEELSARELDAYDPRYPVIVCARAVKP